ncbi:MAG: hypothetical protein HYZ52_03355 [Candidatus Omnitrophica bacterium]|nr:hypothetical protein [Candidatus Omnitrophota bacterium]
MIQKEKLILALDSLIELEKRLAVLFHRDMASSLSFGGLGEADRRKILEYFQARAVIQTKHANAIGEIKKEAQGGRSDVY